MIQVVKVFIAVLLLSTPTSLWAADGDVFTVKTAEGVEMTFKVISEAEKTCQVGSGEKDSPCINRTTNGIISIPSSPNGYKLESIGDYAFYNCYYLTSITIPNSVTSIGNRAFYGCFYLTSITIPNSVTSIEEGAFYFCSGLTSMTIPNSVTSIGNSAFSDCSRLTSITIPNSVTSIGYSVFSWCRGLTSITIPNSVTSIGGYAFWHCSGLASITIPNSVTSIDDDAFNDCSGLTSILVQEGNMVYDSRNNCNAIIETASNTLISGCKNTTIPNSVTSIGKYAFSGCSDLTSITIPNSVTSIGNLAFDDCSGLTSIIVQEGNMIYDSRNNCNAIIETASNTLISGCKNTTIPNSVKSIGDYAFSGCTGLTSITIPNSVTSIGQSAFSSCDALTSINISNSVMSIGDYAFRYCKTLTSITIPRFVKDFGRVAFYNCSNLKSIYSEILEPVAANSITMSTPTAADVTLYVRSGTKTKYEKTEGWKEFTNIVELPKELNKDDTFIGYSQEGNELIFKVTNEEQMTCQIGDGINTSIVQSVRQITIPEMVKGYEVTEIGNGAFLNCSSLQEASSYTVRNIGDRAFAGCTSLQKMSFPQLALLGNNVFNGCTSLLSVVFPKEMTTIDNNILSGCSSLAAIQWDSESAFPTSAIKDINNPNLLLYVKKKEYAPSNLQNVIVNGVADRIILNESANGNNFYCPKEFIAKNIEYTHNYSMTSGYQTCQGWETIALPFDVTRISHESSVELVPINMWNVGSNLRPFWLYEQTTEGWKASSIIKGNQPYILCIPNNPDHYEPLYNFTGDVTFVGSNVKVYASDDIEPSKYGQRAFVPNFQYRESGNDIYTLNVNNQWGQNTLTDHLPGSVFVPNTRPVHPFEAYMTYEDGSAREFIPVFEDTLPTGIPGIRSVNVKEEEHWYTLDGQKLQSKPAIKGIYIVSGRKVVVK